MAFNWTLDDRNGKREVGLEEGDEEEGEELEVGEHDEGCIVE